MMHLNGNVLCSIDFETTGLIAGFHDAIEVAVVPLDANLEPMKDVLPFNTMLKPKRPQNIDPEALKVNGISLAQLEVQGMDALKGADFFVEWYERLNLVPGKKICPLAKNWPFDRDFMKDWLGPHTFNSMFYHRFRDVTPVVEFFNDRADFQNLQAPFPQTALEDVVSRMGLRYPTQAHRSLDDALMTAAVYRRLMFQFIK